MQATAHEDKAVATHSKTIRSSKAQQELTAETQAT
jgi:hypothetical protein